ncbi:CynX/NimT family MFS transporter [Virgibacillus alimentarius]|uniref:CP family cyanate transporter-like MFS transporter n=1 Tax=Virgibacillus alimentarius TaxID=698769 RepID=A0ABS4S9U5_9BACI|nr:MULTISPECIES: MFS transporter [Virgibacillus]MBP2258278.1 CP family cyanate transporter-like MFS transporter [Virgibacillus alimentarius]HLR67344.1 MFS transporter [Virgibacillus sp.]
MEKNISTLEKNRGHGPTWILLIGIILIGANLRAPLTSVGSLISFIRDDLEISNALAGSITTLPLLAFAFLSPFAPKIANRFGMERTIFISLLLLAIGIIVRSFFGSVSLFAGTILIGLAIAFGNVLLPGFIKMNFPFKVGVMTGIYAVFMNLFGALASGLSVPISTIGNMGWQGALAFWGIPAMIALLVWMPQLFREQKSPKAKEDSPSQKGKSIWRSPLAWNITLFMGLQSLIFYTLITWMPEILQSHGYSSSTAGWMLFLMQFALIPLTFIIPVVAEKMKNQKLLAGITAILFIAGIGGLLSSVQSLMIPSAILIGMGAGSAFSLSMMFFTLRTTNGQQASEMSGMAQSFGYLLAAAGPVLFGALHDITSGWQVPLLMLIGISVVILIVGIESGKKRVIEDTQIQENSSLHLG